MAGTTGNGTNSTMNSIYSYVRLEGSMKGGFLASLYIPKIGGMADATAASTGDTFLGHSSTEKNADDTNVTAAIAARDQAFTLDYNAANFNGVASFYKESAFLMTQGAHPPRIDAILPQSEIERFFMEAYNSGLKPVMLSPSKCFAEGDSIVHEIGTANPLPDPYYVRWERTADVWKIAFDIMAIGE